MKNKIIIVSTVLVLSLLFSGTATAKTITVDDSGNSDYTSIQDAINSNIDSSGNLIDTDITIIVYPGVYQENLKLLFPMNLKAYSSNPADTIIESDRYAIDFSDNFRNGKYLISGFTIKGAEAGIYCPRVTVVDVIIENNVINDGNYGIYLYEVTSTIQNNTLKNNACGLYLNRCDPCEIIENNFTENNVGLETQDCRPNIKNNLFTKNELAIKSTYGGPQVTNNTIRDNTAGISIGVTSGTLIASNVIEGNLDHGIDYTSDSRAMVYNNYFNNEINMEGMISSGISLSIEKTEGPNIVGGPYIGGNFWGKPDGTGFSQTHADTDNDGFCDEPYIIDDYFNVVDYLPLKKIPKQTVTVDDSGGCDYTSIQNAIDDNVDTSNITIVVYPGVYKESLKLLVPLNLKAYSSNPADTVIESDEYALDLSDVISTGYPLEFSISGFTIRGSEAGIYEEGNFASGGPLLFLTIENNMIADGNYGVYLCEDFLTIRNNTFKNNTCGLYVERCDPSGGIFGNEFTDNSLGLRTNDCFANVKNNTFTKNELAIASAAFEGPKITCNIIRENNAGISIGTTYGTLIASNIIEGNLDYGIDYTLASGAKVYDNCFNNTINAKGIPGSETSFSIEAIEGPNIVGGPYIGGNFWGKPDGTGFSQTHADTDNNGFCDEPYIIDDYFNIVDYLPLKNIDTIIDITNPVIDSVVLFPANTTSNSMITISINAIDDTEVTEVIAGDIQLTKTDDIWQGSIIAPSSVGSYSLHITAKDAAGNIAETSVPYYVVQLSGGANIAVSPRSSRVAAGNIVSLSIKVKNAQNTDDTLKVRVSVSELPASYQADLSWFDWTEKAVSLKAGEEVLIPVDVTVPEGTAAGRKLFRANVNSETSSTTGFDTGYIVIS